MLGNSVGTAVHNETRSMGIGFGVGEMLSSILNVLRKKKKCLMSRSQIDRFWHMDGHMEYQCKGIWQ